MIDSYVDFLMAALLTILVLGLALAVVAGAFALYAGWAGVCS